MKHVSALAASLLSVAAFAQDAAPASAGLLGQRYVDTGFSWVDINHSSVEGMSYGLSVNLPVNSNFDVAAYYGYSWTEGAFEIGHSAGVAVTAYTAYNDYKPFATLSTGYNWMNNDLDGDHGVWGVEVGVERTITAKIAATVSVGYDDDFGQHRDGAWDVTLGGTYNITDKLVAEADIALIEGGSIGYGLGVAYRF